MSIEYILFPDCQLVKGFRKCAVCDLARNKILFIPNSLYDILSEYNGFPLSHLKEIYPGEEDTLDEYLEFLILHEFVYKSKYDLPFDVISSEFKTSSLINNAIIDVSIGSNHDFEKLVSEIDKAGCSSVLIRFYSLNSINEISRILSFFEISDIIIDINIMLPYLKGNSKVIKKIIARDTQISHVAIFSSPYNKLSEFRDVTIHYLKQKIYDQTYCGNIGCKNFSVNMKMYLESKNYNNCLYKKLSVDTHGNIKNCPSCEKSFGLLDEVSFSDILSNPEFTKLWYIKKDDIEVCKDCECRYVCLDCRVYRCDPDNIYSKPLKCKYNPYEKN